MFDALRDAASGARHTVGGAVDAVGSKVDDLTSQLSKVKNELSAQADAFAAEKRQMLKDFESEKKRWIAGQLYRKIDGILDFAMTKFGNFLKDSYHDPYMPGCIEVLIDDFVDAIWPDVKEEFKDVILQGLVPDKAIAHGNPPGCCVCCGYTPIGWLRYTIYPYDRNIWRLIRDPFWWLFALATVFPKFGVSQVAYGLMFLFIDRDDEFQLQQYIISFKSLQFLSLGILSALIGSAQYYVCTSMDNCPKYAPQESAWTVALFILQIFFVWAAFLCLNCSVKKGGQFYQLQRQRRHAGSQGIDELNEICIEASVTTDGLQFAGVEVMSRARWRLMKFLLYDFIIFLICIGLGCFMAFKNFTDKSAQLTGNTAKGNWNSLNGEQGGGNWKFKSGLYWLKAFYGLMSFPFVILMVPGISSLLSHARPTGYNRWGRCVPYLGHEEEQPTPWRPWAYDKRTGQRKESGPFAPTERTEPVP